MTFTCTKRFHFAASHQLDGLVEDHQCSRLHGHNYEVELEVAADRLDENGMVFDYGEMAPFGDFLAVKLDHRHLNDLVDFNPTAERLAWWLADQALDLLELPAWAHISAVRVMETPRSVAEYRP